MLLQSAGGRRKTIFSVNVSNLSILKIMCGNVHKGDVILLIKWPLNSVFDTFKSIYPFYVINLSIGKNLAQCTNQYISLYTHSHANANYSTIQ